MDAAGQEVVLQDGLTQEVVALLRAVAAERRGMGQLVGGAVHGLDDSGTERAGDVADAQRDHVGSRMGGAEGIDALGHVGKQVVVGQFQEVFVD